MSVNEPIEHSRGNDTRLQTGNSEAVRRRFFESFTSGEGNVGGTGILGQKPGSR
jgi:hypothetical protein